MSPYRGIHLDKLTTRLRRSDGQVSAEDLVATVNDGELRGSLISMGLVDEKPAFELRLQLNDVGLRSTMAPLLTCALPFLGKEGVGLEGKIQAGLAIGGKGFGLADLKKNLQGSGSIRLAEGQLKTSPFLKELSKLLKTPLDDASFEKMGSDFKIDTGKIASSNVFFKPRGSKLRELQLSGTTSFDQQISYGVKVSALKDAIGDRKIRKILEIAEKALGDRGIPLRLLGSMTNPKLTLIPTNFPTLDEILGKGAGLDKVLKDSGLGDFLGGSKKGQQGDAREQGSREKTDSSKETGN